jgi:hypothetical protein
MKDIVKGLLVYATGKTEEVVSPEGQTLVKVCEHCGSGLRFENAGLAEDSQTVTPGSRDADKLDRIEQFTGRRAATNPGCLVYIQRRQR